MTDIYYGVGPIPKGKRRATMKEAAIAGQIRFWGSNKADNKILSLKKAEKAKEEGKQNIMLDIAKYGGKKKYLTSKIQYEKDADKKKEYEKELKQVHRKLDELNKKLQLSFVKEDVKEVVKKDVKEDVKPIRKNIIVDKKKILELTKKEMTLEEFKSEGQKKNEKNEKEINKKIKDVLGKTYKSEGQEKNEKKQKEMNKKVNEITKSQKLRDLEKELKKKNNELNKKIKQTILKKKIS